MKERFGAMKTKAKFNIIDVLLILIIAAAAVFGAVILRSGRLGAEEASAERSIRYTVLLSNVKSQFIRNIQPGDSVTDTVKLMPIGEVKDVRSDFATVQIEDYNAGRIVTATVPDTYDVYVTVEAMATVSDGAYMIGGYQINVGTLVSLRVPNYTGSGFCTAVSEVE